MAETTRITTCYTHYGDAVYGTTVAFGGHNGLSTDHRRQYYTSRARAERADISESGDIPAADIRWDPAVRTRCYGCGQTHGMGERCTLGR